MGFDLNPISWIGDAVAWTEAELAQGVAWVDSELGQAAGWTEAELKKVGPDVASFVDRGLHGLEVLTLDAVSLVHNFTLDAWRIGEAATSDARDALDWIGGAAEWLDREVQGPLNVFMRDVVDPAIHAAEIAAGAVGASLVAVVDDVKQEADQLYKNTVPELEHWVDESATWFGHELRAGYGDILRDVVDPAIHDVEAGLADVSKLVAYGVDDVIKAAELAIKAADWLTWFGLHTLEDLGTEAGDLFDSVGLSTLHSMDTYAAGLVPDVESVFTTLLER